MIGETEVGLLMMNLKLKVFLRINHLKSIRRCNFNRSVLAHLNINSIRNKFDNLTHLFPVHPFSTPENRNP